MSERGPVSAPFRYAGASIDITPPMPTTLAGYSGRVARHRSVAVPLEANAVLLEDAAGKRVLFVCADVLFLGRDLLSVIRAIARRHGLSDGDVVATASHTHFAPAVDSTKPLIGEVDANYRELIAERLSRLVETVLTAERRRATMHVARSVLPLTVHRRRPWLLPTLSSRGIAWPPTIAMAASVGQTIDQSLDAIILRDEAHAPVAVCWKYACHPVCFPDPSAVTSEYPGYARTRLRSSLQRSIPVVFWQGFAGDVRPRLEGRNTMPARLSALVRGPTFAPVNSGQWTAWADHVSAGLLATVQQASAVRVASTLRVRSTGVPLNGIIDTTRNPDWAGRSMEIARVDFGSQVELLCAAAEVCSPYLDMLPENPNRVGIRIGYTGEVFGYLPSQQQVKEGGYEGGGFFPAFSLQGEFRPGFETRVRDAARTLERSDHEMSSSIG